MTNPYLALANSQTADNSTLYTLLFFLNYIEESRLGVINVDESITQFDRGTLVFAVSIIENILGIQTPDSCLEDSTLTVRQLADRMRLQPRLSDKEFRYKLLQDQAAWSAVVRTN